MTHDDNNNDGELQWGTFTAASNLLSQLLFGLVPPSPMMIENNDGHYNPVDQDGSSRVVTIAAFLLRFKK